MYKSLKEKLALLDCAIKMHDGNAITAVSVEIKIKSFIIMGLSDAKLQYTSGSLRTVIQEAHLLLNRPCCY